MNPPKKVTFLISLILGALGVIGKFIAIPFVSAYAFWFVTVALALLLLGCFVKGL